MTDKFDRLSEKVDLLVEAVDGLKTDLDSVKTDLDSVKTDMEDVKTDLGGVKTDLNAIKGDLGTKASSEELERLYSHMQKRFDDFDAKLDEKASQKDVDRVLNVLDSHTMKFDDIELEMAAFSAKVDRYHPA